MQYSIYLRKSRADAEAELRGEGETLLRHEKALTALARSQNLYVCQIYREIVSGDTIAARPVMQRLLAEVEKGVWDGVLVMEIERLARGDTIDQGIVAQTFKYSGTKIITPAKTYDPNDEFDEEYFEFGLFMSRREYKAINRRLQRGRIASVKEGNYIGGQVPYGYRRKKENGRVTLEIVPKEADIVRFIFDSYVNGAYDEQGNKTCIGAGKIASHLASMGIPTKKNSSWRAETVRGILSNPVYIGKIRWHWRERNKKMANGKIVIERPIADKSTNIIADGRHAPIVDEKIFNRAQEIIKKRYAWPVKDRSAVKNPLAGIVICSKCGRTMIRQPRKNGPPLLRCANSSCGNISSVLGTVEEKILQAMCIWLDRYRIPIAPDEDNRELPLRENLLNRIDSELRTLRTQSESLCDLLERGVYSAELYQARRSNIDARMQALEAEKCGMEQALFSAAEKESAPGSPEPEDIANIYRALSTPAGKNRLLREILEKVEYFKEQPNRGTVNDDFRITVYPRLPRDPPDI